MRISYTHLFAKLERNTSKDVSLVGMIILKCVLHKEGVKAIQLAEQNVQGRAVVKTVMNNRFTTSTPSQVTYG
jgi:hypothetical protein